MEMPMTNSDSNTLIDRAIVREWLDAACSELTHDPTNEKLQQLVVLICETWSIPIPNELIRIVKKH